MFTFWEKLEDSRRVSDSGRRIEIHYFGQGTEDYFTILGRIALDTPTELSGVPRANIEFDPVEDIGDLWDIVVTYQVGGGGGSGGTPTDIGDERESFSTRGNKIRIFQAAEHIADYANTDVGQEPPSFDGAINVTNEGVEGVEIDHPGFVFQIRQIVAIEQVTQAYRRNLLAATHKVNSSPWRGFQPGELRFLGAEASQRDAESFELIFDFMALENESDIDLGDLAGITVDGHDYLWARYEAIVDESADPPLKRQKVVSAHVERVYKRVDFAQLLGLSP